MQDARKRLEAILAERIAVLDGSWGVLIQRRIRGEEAYRGERFRDHPRDLAGDPDLLNLTRPEVVLDIHRAYFEAGADIATTNTFTATTIGQSDYGLEAHAGEMSLEGSERNSCSCSRSDCRRGMACFALQRTQARWGRPRLNSRVPIPPSASSGATASRSAKRSRSFMPKAYPSIECAPRRRTRRSRPSGSRTTCGGRGRPLYVEACDAA